MAKSFKISDRNTKNPDSSLFKKLTRLFSGPIVDYRRQTERSLRRNRLQKYRSQIKDLTGNSFSKTSHNPFENLYLESQKDMARAQRYAEFDQLEFIPELASALDIYADEMTTNSDLNPLLRIRCTNAEIKNVLDILYHKVLNIDFNLFGWSRTMCKYGDYYLYLDIDEKEGIKNVIGISPHEMERLEGEDPTNPNYVRFSWTNMNMVFENWQVSHFRILGNDKYVPLGTSVLDPARRIARQLILIEDAVLAYRIVRTPERRIFYVDVGSIAAEDVPTFMQQFMTNMKRNQVVDSLTGRIDLRYNPMGTDEDYYIPVRGNTSGTKIEPLPGGSYTGDIEDIKYFRDKLFSAIKIPMSYLSRGDGASEDKASLSQKDLRFARTIQRLQRSVISELEKIGIIHLYVLGYRNQDLLSFKLSLNNPSKLAEMQELEHWKTKFDVASAATEGFFSRRWIAEKLFSLSEEEFIRCQREMFFDRKLTADLEQISEGEDSISSEGDMGLDLDSEEEGSEEDEVLLAKPPPGKRDEPTLSPRSKGKVYYPVKDDHRDSGALKRHYQGKYAKEMASSTSRNLFKGNEDFSKISKGMMEKTNYKEEEQMVLENVRFSKECQDIESLLESLEKAIDIEKKSVKSNEEVVRKLLKKKR